MSDMSPRQNPWLEHDRQVFEACLDQVRTAAFGATEGLFEPGGITWRVTREAAILSGGGRALLLQLAHPAVAEAVDSDSSFRRDLIGRGQRTFTSVYRIFFGDLDTAVRAARYVHNLHDRVFGQLSPESSSRRAGQPYRANEPQALMWVWATLMDTALRVYEEVVVRLKPAERRRFYDDTRLFAVLMGVPAEQVPPDEPSFQAYWESMVAGPGLEVGHTARRLGDELFATLGPARGVNRSLASGWMPERLRGGFGLTWTRRDRTVWTTAVACLRAGLPLTPAALRYPPAYHQAVSRIAAARHQTPPVASRLVSRVNRVIALPLGL
jgi:uncharacterized protein (DUF2236 family)